ncbi:uncharacterized protein LOC125554973 [Triticum urartu]|uniref:uncharacterized protein LOC125554973 n=1 Tax=Triticum urartu TaxID=4572 RepID=UPI0020443737|nr:uncharacterized protein LOC125554973 [Triticum urartu]
MADGKLDPPAGYAFEPAEHELITKFLRPRIAAGPDAFFASRLIHEFDAYSAAPGDLVEMYQHAQGTDKGDGKGGVWYFFTHARRHQTKGGRGGGRRQRAVADAGEGYCWHSEKGGIPVLDNQGKLVGHRRNLSYVKKLPREKEKIRIGWCMAEYSLDGDGKQDGLVLCKVCVSRHRSETTYDEVINAPGSRKRKAADVQHPDAPRTQTPRRQEPPIVQQPGMLHEYGRWFMSDEGETLLPPGAVDDGSVDPGGFFTDDMLQDFPELHDAVVAQGFLPGKLDGAVQEGIGAAEDEDDAFRCTLDELLGFCDDTTVLV